MNWKKIIAIGLTGCFLFSGCAEQRQNAQKMGEEGTQGGQLRIHNLRHGYCYDLPYSCP